MVRSDEQFGIEIERKNRPGSQPSLNWWKYWVVNLGDQLGTEPVLEPEGGSEQVVRVLLAVNRKTPLNSLPVSHLREAQHLLPFRWHKQRAVHVAAARRLRKMTVRMT